MNKNKKFFLSFRQTHGIFHILPSPLPLPLSKQVIANLWRIIDKSGIGRDRVLDIAKQVGEAGERFQGGVRGAGDGLLLQGSPCARQCLHALVCVA